ncbi:MAG: filamentous hemagglutinin N-terminal domain-containing protein [Pseudomonadota bacterium]
MRSRASLNHVYRTVWNQSLGAMVAVAEIATGGGRSGSASGASLGSSHHNPFAFINLSALALGVALAWGALTDNALANPSGGVAVAGQATMVTTGNQLLVTTQNGAGTNHSAINWQSFSIPAGNTTHFQQPSAVSTVINRVVSNTPSAIFGTLSSNGNLVLVNQSGIAVGAGAVVDTAGFTASSLRMSDADAVAGRMRFGDAGGSAGGVSVQGSVLARSGDVVLLGTNVDTGNTALVQAPNGSTILAAGQQIEITGRGLEGITLQVQAPVDQAVNLGTLKGGAVGIFAGTLKHSGLIHATKASLEGGKVVLKASGDAFVEGAGKIVATGTVGGSVDVLGNRVAVTDQSVIDVSGDQGGGSVRVGGDYQGKNVNVQNADFVYFGPQASVKADAIGSGNGGRVILWADDTTRAHGGISARGGVQGGDGGFVETSGKQNLSLSGIRVDTRGPLGTTGLWLLDPNNIDIAASPTTVGVTGGPFSFTGLGTLDVVDLQNGLLSSNVSVTAGDNLTVSAAITPGGSGSLFLTAGGSLSVNAPISLNTNLALESTSGSTFLGANVNLGTGAVKLKSGGSISQSTGVITAGTLEIDSGASVSLNSANAVTTLAANTGSGGFSYRGASGLTVGSVGSITGISASGGINLEGAGSIQVDQKIDAGSGAISLISTGGGISQNGANSPAISGSSLSANALNGVVLNNNANSVGTFNATTSGVSAPVSYWNAGSFAVGAISATGVVTLKTNGGNLAQTGAISTGGASYGLDVNASGGNVALNNPSNNLGKLTITGGGTVSVKNSTAIDLYSINAGSFMLKAGGNITQSGAVNTSAGGIDILTTAGSISSGEGISAVGGAVRLAATSGITLTSTAVGVNSDATGDAVLFITTGGLLTVNALTPVTTSGAGGRWLAYVPSFTSNVFPTFTGSMAFKQYNATFGTAVLGSGNGVLVAAAPVLTLSAGSVTGSVSKVYDGGTGIGLTGAVLPTVTGGAIDSDVLSGAVLTGGSGTLDNRHVGTGKNVTVGGMTVTGITTSSGKPVYGYLTPSVNGSIGTVTQRPSSTWVGGPGGSWGLASNWDALPDGENVADVIIPAGVGPIVFDGNVGTTSLQSLTSGSTILVAGGVLQISNSLTTSGFTQSGGAVGGSGTFKVNGEFNQTGGSVEMSAIDVTTPNGGIVFYRLRAPTVSLAALNGPIMQLGGVETTVLTTNSTGGTVLNGPENHIASFSASNSGSGSIELTNVGVLNILGINNGGGNIVVSNTGGVSTVGSVTASGGKVSITANSPLTIGAGGVSASGDINLLATNATSSGNMVLDGTVSSTSGAVYLGAANNLTQNSAVFGAAGVTAAVGGTFTVGPSATSGTTPVNYSVGGQPVPAPPIQVGAPPASPIIPPPSTSPTSPTTPTSPTVPTTPIAPTSPIDASARPGSFDVVKDSVVQLNLVTTFLDKFEVAVQTRNDEKRDGDKSKNEVVVEGEICRP